MGQSQQPPERRSPGRPRVGDLDGAQLTGLRGVQEAVSQISRWLMAIYALDFEFSAGPYVISHRAARELTGGHLPRSGVLVRQWDGEAEIGLYLDPRDATAAGVVVEETSHLVCLAWHAARDLPVSRLHLEFQAEVDRYAVDRLAGRDGFAHFRNFRWASFLDVEERQRYRAAHRLGERFCRALTARHPRRCDTPGLLRALRSFYRAAPERRLQAAERIAVH